MVVSPSILITKRLFGVPRYMFFFLFSPRHPTWEAAAVPVRLARAASDLLQAASLVATVFSELGPLISF